MQRDQQFMEIALACAEAGRGSVEPNPMVGAVIAQGDQEIARGFHGRFGGPHAEIEALKAAAAKGAEVRGCTMYVTLEPCCHRNKKTPPCTQALIAAGLKRVVVAMEDPDPNVRGRGVAELRAAGIDVEVGLSQHQARMLLRGYIKQRTTARPWVICKWAQTPDGYISTPGQRWISCPQSLAMTHHLRSWCQGIAVGIGTAIADDPLLTNRSGSGGQPARLVLDSRLRLSPHSQLAATARQFPLIVAATAAAVAGSSQAARALEDCGAELLILPAVEAGLSLPALLDELGRRSWTYLLVEGGAALLASFVYGRLADELMAFVSPALASEEAGPLQASAPPASAGGAHAPLPRFDARDVAIRLGLAAARTEAVGRDTLYHWPSISSGDLDRIRTRG